MEELIAIISIVILCCLMFGAWLLAMATCPDKMVAFLSGTKSDSTCSSQHESKELISSQFNRSESDIELGRSVSAAYLPLSARRPSDKKLSVVPEQDEQLTVQSTIHSMRPTILRIGSGANTATAPTLSSVVQQLETQKNTHTIDEDNENVDAAENTTGDEKNEETQNTQSTTISCDAVISEAPSNA